MALFFRDGTEFKGEALNSRATRRYPCGKCGGAGRIACFSHVEGGVCFRCEGRRYFEKEEKVYTADKLAKLNASLAKRQTAKAAKHRATEAAIEAEAATKRVAFESEHAEVLNWLASRAVNEYGDIKEGFMGDMLARARRLAEWTPAQRDAIYNSYAKHQAEQTARAASGHVGSVGERIIATVTVLREATFYRTNRFASYGNGSEEVFVTTMRDQSGNTLVVKSPKFREVVGSTIKIRGTVAEHNEYRGERQTILKRAQLAS